MVIEFKKAKNLHTGKVSIGRSFYLHREKALRQRWKKREAFFADQNALSIQPLAADRDPARLNKRLSTETLDHSTSTTIEHPRDVKRQKVEERKPKSTAKSQRQVMRDYLPGKISTKDWSIPNLKAGAVSSLSTVSKTQPQPQTTNNNPKDLDTNHTHNPSFAKPQPQSNISYSKTPDTNTSYTQEPFPTDLQSQSDNNDSKSCDTNISHNRSPPSITPQSRLASNKSKVPDFNTHNTNTSSINSPGTSIPNIQRPSSTTTTEPSSTPQSTNTDKIIASKPTTRDLLISHYMSLEASGKADWRYAI